MIEFSRSKRAIRADRGNHYEKLWLMRISWGSQCILSNMAGKCLDLACNNTDRKLSKPNQASLTLDFSYLLVISKLFLVASPHLSLSFLLLYHHCQNTKFSYLSWFLNAIITSDHGVQHTPSASYTKCGIHQAQHTPESVCRFFIFMITT
jgi:hypothetical protein